MSFNRFTSWINRNTLIVSGIVLVVLIGAAMARKHRENVNLVTGIDPQMHWGVTEMFAALRNLPAAERQAYLHQHWPTLPNDVAASAATYLNGQSIDSVTFKFGSSTNAQANDAAGQMHDGFFSDELIAYVYVHGAPEPKKFLVRCMNGLVIPAYGEANLTYLGSAVPETRFTIAKARGLTSYVNYATSIMLAERHNLPLYRGRTVNGNFVREQRITPAEARQINTDLVPVQVLVYEGDQFDLIAQTYTPAPRPQATAPKSHVRHTRRHR